MRDGGGLLLSDAAVVFFPVILSGQSDICIMSPLRPESQGLVAGKVCAPKGDPGVHALD